MNLTSITEVSVDPTPPRCRNNGHKSHRPRPEDTRMYRPCPAQPSQLSLPANLFSGVDWNDAKKRVITSYRQWLRSVRPDLAHTHPLSLSISLRTRLFEKEPSLADTGHGGSRPGTRDPDHVLAQHTRVGDPDQDTAGV